MHRPGAEVNIVDTSKRLDNNAFGDVQAGWYWRGAEPPDLAAMQAQHDAYVATLRAEGVEVVFLDEVAPGRMKSCFTRDSLIGVGGGAIVTRLGPAHPPRRGTPVTRTLARLGCPILRTVSGTGVAEGGGFAWLNRRTAVIGVSSRVNEEGATQIGEVLRSQGVELLKVPLTGYRLHIDGLFVMLAPDLALASITLLPFWFLQKLHDLGIHLIEIHHEDDASIVNSLAIAPGRVIMPDGVSDHTREQLRRQRCRSITVAYDKMICRRRRPALLHRAADRATRRDHGEREFQRGPEGRARLARRAARGAVGRPHDDLEFPRAVLARIQIVAVVRGPAASRGFRGRAGHRGHADGVPRALAQRRRADARRLCRIRRGARPVAGAGAVSQAARRRQPHAPPATPTRIRRSGSGRLPVSSAPSTRCRRTASAARLSSLASRRRKCAARKPVHAAHGFYDGLDAAFSFHPHSFPALTNGCFWETSSAPYWSRIYTFVCRHPETWQSTGARRRGRARPRQRARPARSMPCA